MRTIRRVKDFIVTLFLAVILTLILSLITKHYFIVSAIIAILLKIFYRRLRGIIGELNVRHKLKKLPKEKYRILNNIMIKKGDKTYQIDHIVVSPFGIFVIEMKNFYGFIFGNIYGDDWIQQFGINGKYKYPFKNPIHQNYGHLKVLEELLNIDYNSFISIVCFSNQVRLSKDISDDVVQLDYLVSAIENYQDVIIEQQEIDVIYNKITELNVTDKLERRRHVKNIKQKIKEDKNKVDNMICPKCGGKLVNRDGKYGPFIGCSNYPICKFTKN